MRVIFRVKVSVKSRHGQGQALVRTSRLPCQAARWPRVQPYSELRMVIVLSVTSSSRNVLDVGRGRRERAERRSHVGTRGAGAQVQILVVALIYASDFELTRV